MDHVFVSEAIRGFACPSARSAEAATTPSSESVSLCKRHDITMVDECKQTW